MKITVLTENTTCREELQPEHGLSLYLETKGEKILFDAGQTDAFWKNSEKLGIDLREVGIAILSHGHNDHGGGMLTFLGKNDKAPLYLHRCAFASCHNGEGKYIGLDPQLKCSPRLRFTQGKQLLGEGIWLADCNRRKKVLPTQTYGLSVRRGKNFYPDRFYHEQYLLVEEKGKRICISGCSHKGVMNILRWFQPDVLVGGFHFMKIEDEAVLESLARQLLEGNTVYYTGHCTGSSQYGFLKERMGDRLQAFQTGTIMEI